MSRRGSIDSFPSVCGSFVRKSSVSYLLERVVDNGCGLDVSCSDARKSLRRVDFSSDTVNEITGSV